MPADVCGKSYSVMNGWILNDLERNTLRYSNITKPVLK
ncbi:hypothetical protein SeseC_02317 [Streptococcus equi subsp. zooepidemicus ATCC 35246]|nr:hypothetical protein SeseC_02317 [Streptococcus equi subsp. zooepidemicus ATCC 35246]